MTRLTLRPVSNALPANAFGTAASGQILARSMAAFGSYSAHTRAESVDEQTPSGRVRGEWVRTRDTTDETGVLFYLHGSGYAVCSTATHRRLVSQLAARTGLRVFSLEYRLAPRHRFPAAADDVERAFTWLLEQHADAHRIVVAGDSAGGHLAFDLAVDRARKNLPRHAGQLLMSPLADVTLELARRREEALPDPMASAAAARRLLTHYTRDTDPGHDRLTHRLRPDETLPPTLIQAGGAEMLAADAHALHDELRGTDTWCQLEVWPGQMHVFQAMPRLVPEASAALDRGARFLREALDGTLDHTRPDRPRTVGDTRRTA